MSSGNSHIQNQYIEDIVTNDTAISSSEITATKGKYHKHYDGNQSATRQLTNHGMSMPAYHTMLCTTKGKQYTQHGANPVHQTLMQSHQDGKHPEITAYLASQVY
jgi:copper oxidase (laccase) domain-containing protein